MTDLVILLTIVLIIVVLCAAASNARKANGADGAGSTAAGAEKLNPVEGDRSQIVEDMKATKTARIADQVAILEDLDAISPGHRQFCELTGTTQQTGGVTAPYSKRQVAYYDVRCYKIERVNGHDIETLVAQEHSIEPFYFTDGSGDDKVYVALDSFGSNCILVNSANHIEGPGSDFSKAFSTKAGSVSRTINASYMVDGSSKAGGKLLRAARPWAEARQRRMSAPVSTPALVPIGKPHVATQAERWLLLAQRQVERGIGQVNRRFSHLMRSARRACAALPSLLAYPQPACAAAAASANAPSAAGFHAFSSPRRDDALNGFHFAGGPGGPGGPGGGFGGPGGGMGGRPPMGGPGGMPSGLDSFLGLGGAGFGGLQQNPNLGGPRSPHYRGSGNDMGTALLDIGLGALLATAANSAGSQDGNPAYTQTNNTFMGYRIMEDVVPLNYPVYCLGEIYKNGTDVYMGKSTGSVSSSYFFATKLEAEVIAHLQ